MCFRFLSRNCKYKKWDLYLSSEQYTSCVISDNLSHTCPSQGTEGERCEWWSEDRETACSVLRCTIISILSKQTRKQNKNMCFSSLFEVWVMGYRGCGWKLKSQKRRVRALQHCACPQAPQLSQYKGEGSTAMVEGWKKAPQLSQYKGERSTATVEGWKK